MRLLLSVKVGWKCSGSESCLKYRDIPGGRLKEEGVDVLGRIECLTGLDCIFKVQRAFFDIFLFMI